MENARWHGNRGTETSIFQSIKIFKVKLKCSNIKTVSRTRLFCGEKQLLLHSVNQETRNPCAGSCSATLPYIFDMELMKHQREVCHRLHENKLGPKEQEIKGAESTMQFHLSREWLIRELQQWLIPDHLYQAVRLPLRVRQQPRIFIIICITTNYNHDFQSLSCSCIISDVNACKLMLPRSQCPQSFDSPCLQESSSGSQGKEEGVERVESITEVKIFSRRIITALLNEDE